MSGHLGYWLLRLLPLGLILVAFARLASLDPDGEKAAWRGLAKDVGLAFGVAILWLVFGLAVAFSVIHGFDASDETAICISSGALILGLALVQPVTMGARSNNEPRKPVILVGGGLLGLVLIGIGVSQLVRH